MSNTAASFGFPTQFFLGYAPFFQGGWLDELVQGTNGNIGKVNSTAISVPHDFQIAWNSPQG